ncbi:MAG: hypothetical protein ACE5GW_00680 [Planctomycetota bacterium]
MAYRPQRQHLAHLMAPIPLILLGAFILSAPAQEGKDAGGAAKATPKSDERALAVLREAVEALGGPEGYRSMANSRLTARASIPGGETGATIELELILHTRDDGARRLEKRVGGESDTFVTDGESYWMILPSSGVLEMPPAVAQGMRIDQLQQELFLDHEEHGYLALGGEEVKADGRTLRRVTFRSRESFSRAGKAEEAGDRIEYLFDAETHLPAESRFLYPDPWGGKAFRLTVKWDDYRPVSAVPLPHRIVHVREGKVLVELQVTSMEIGKRFDDTLFRRPKKKE